MTVAIPSKFYQQFQTAVLAWFDKNARTLPWRTKAPRDPYKVWLAEIMLQQTTVPAVIPYYEKFLRTYPNVKSLAAAEREEVLKNWAGLGYYSRARNLHECARVIVQDFGGTFPQSEKGLLLLPGIGPYTAAAIAAIAFNQNSVVVDGNIERVMSRLFGVRTPWPKSKPELKKLASTLTPDKRPGDYAESLMDLGAMVCTPKNPECNVCPVSRFCKAFKAGQQDELPIREAKNTKPTRRGYVFWLEDRGRVLTRRRAEKGLLGGMPEFPTSNWSEKFPESFDDAPGKSKWQPVGEVTHTFTHFHLVLKVFKGAGPSNDGEWVAKENLPAHGFPTVMKKVLDLLEMN